MAAKRATSKPGIARVPLDKLHLDGRNPRLPEDLHGAAEPKILEYLFREGLLEELANSFADNGYFPGEPLIVVSRRGGGYTVLEGNRRLAALKILTGLAEIDGAAFDVDVSDQDLESVPCVVAESRDEVAGLIGFRHIGGLKMWTPAAKARYVAQEVDALASTSSDPFREFGRKVGSNATGIRGSYQAYVVLRYARDELSLKDVNRLLLERKFGVWQRALNSPDIRESIRFDAPPGYADTKKALRRLDSRNLQNVIWDLAGREDLPPIVSDSRLLTDYGRILVDKRAERVLRKTNSFDQAKIHIAGESAKVRIQKVRLTLEVLIDEVDGLDSCSSDLLEEVRELARLARRLELVAKDKPSTG